MRVFPLCLLLLLLLSCRIQWRIIVPNHPSVGIGEGMLRVGVQQRAEME